MAIGFVLPPEIVPNSTSNDVIGDGLSYMAYGNAAFATVISILIIICESADSGNISVAVYMRYFMIVLTITLGKPHIFMVVAFIVFL